MKGKAKSSNSQNLKVKPNVQLVCKLIISEQNSSCKLMSEIINSELMFNVVIKWMKLK